MTEAIKLATEQYYKDYESRRGAKRNDILRNREVLFQVLAADASLISALRSIEPNPTHARVLDIGCGDGASLLPFLRLGFEPSNLYGVDIRSNKIDVARNRFPASHFKCADASCLDFSDASFDITQEFMMFLQMTDDELSARVAAEMLRVTKHGGHLLLSDWRYAMPGTEEFKAVDKARISKLFRVGKETAIVGTAPGALVPPVGRFFSKMLPAMYFVVGTLFPILVGQFVTVLRKIE